MARKETLRVSPNPPGRPRLDRPTSVDVHVGGRIRVLRRLKRMSQGDLGKRIGVTFQQVQKYESGGNRLVASRLFELSRVLGVNVQYFFDGVEKTPGFEVPKPYAADLEGRPAEEPPSPASLDPRNEREKFDLEKQFFRISSPVVRRRVFELAKAIAVAEARARSR